MNIKISRRVYGRVEEREKKMKGAGGHERSLTPSLPNTSVLPMLNQNDDFLLAWKSDLSKSVLRLFHDIWK